ncbi:MAG: GNAT family N-acetyltransferase [Fusobacteriota bacterium]
MENLNFYLIDRDEIKIIKPLWEELNNYHEKKAIDFKEYFKNNNFEDRVKKVLERKKLRIELVKDMVKRNIIGYCITSIDDNKGEIDSIYIQRKYRGLKIGNILIERALDWLDDEKVKTQSVSVAYGNIEVLDFYKKVGFKPRLIIMERD